MTALLVEHLPVIASAPNGVKKLRDLILQLAVMGKLVPQDPSDEPALQLLRRVGLPLKMATQREPLRLPACWCWTTIEHIASLKSGTSLPSALELPKGDYLYIKVSDMNLSGNEIEITCSSRYVSEFPGVKDKLIPANSIIFPKRGGAIATNKKRLVTGPLLADSNVMALSCPEWLDLRYLHCWFLSVDLWKLNSGTSVPQINNKDILPLSFPLPPRAEQHRIVAKVDELMALCDRLDAQQSDAEGAHKQIVKALLDSLLQSINQADFANSWERIKQNFHVIFTTESSIHALREALLEVAVTGRLEDPSSFSWCNKQSLSEVNQPTSFAIEENLPNLLRIKGDQPDLHLPIGWRWVSLRDLVVKSGSGWSPSCEGRPRVGTEWVVLKVSAVSWGRFLPEMNKALPSRLSPRPDCEVNEGDFLISRANTKELVARSVVVRKCPPRLMMSDKIVRLQLSDLIDKDFLQLYNNSSLARAYYERVAGGTSSSMKNVTRDQILALPVPLPPLVVQQKLVRIVGEWFDVCDNLASQMAQSISLSEDVASAVLENCLL